MKKQDSNNSKIRTGKKTPVRIIIENLRIRYRSMDKCILDEVSFEVPPGETFVILGPSGSGKTTLLRSIAGFLRPVAPTTGLISKCIRQLIQNEENMSEFSGKILFDSNEVTCLPPQMRNVAMVRQTWDLLPHLTVKKSLMLPLIIRGEAQRAESAANSMIEQLNLVDKADKRPDSLSGGEIQRVALGRLLVRDDASVYLFDECLSSLDPILRMQLMQDIKTLLLEKKVTTLWVTHLSDEARYMADTTAIIANGKLQQIGKINEIEKTPANLTVFKLISGQTDNNLLSVFFNNGVPYYRNKPIPFPILEGYTGDAILAVQNDGWEIDPDGLIEGCVKQKINLGVKKSKLYVSIEGMDAELLTSNNISEMRNIKLSLSDDSVLYFAPDTGKRLIHDS